MTYYILKLIIMLPIMAGLIYGSLWIYRKYQISPMIGAMGGARQKRELKVLETMAMNTSGKLVVVEFGGQKILLSASRGAIRHIANAPIDEGAAGPVMDSPCSNDVSKLPDLPQHAMPFQTLIKNALQPARKKEF